MLFDVFLQGCNALTLLNFLFLDGLDVGALGHDGLHQLINIGLEGGLGGAMLLLKHDDFAGLGNARLVLRQEHIA